MLYITSPKRYVYCVHYLVHYFFFYTIVVAYFTCTSCHGIRTELIPVRNAILGELSKNSQEDYLTLTQMMLDDHEKEQLEKKVHTIKNPAILENFIKQSLQNRIAYDSLRKLLPKPERTALEQKVANAMHQDEQAKLIGHYLNALQMIQNAPMSNRQNYIDLLEILPDDQAIALKEKVVQSTSPDEVAQLIAWKLPTSFKQLDDHAKESLAKLPDRERQSILKTAMHHNDIKGDGDIHTRAVTDGAHTAAQPNEKNSFAPRQEHPSKVKPNNKPTALHASKDGHSNLFYSKSDIKMLITQKVKEQEAKAEKGIPQDGWGSKLPLEGKARKQFLISIMQFSQSDQKMLKELFDRTNSNSIYNFLSVYHTGFNKDARIELLSTIIYLYKGWPKLTLKLCNNPTSLSFWDKVTFFQKLEGNQLDLLKQLDHLLSQL